MTEWDRVAHLEAALESAENDQARYHIRAALQYQPIRRGDLEGSNDD